MEGRFSRLDSAAMDIPRNSRVQTACLALMSCIAVVLLALLFGSARHGFELTDEGFYWASMAHPWALSASATQFGFVYHPLYLALDGNLVLVRQANLVLTVLLGFGLAFMLVRQQRSASPGPLWLDVMTAFLLAFPVLLIFSVTMPTPSYNSLSLQGVMIVAMGLMMTFQAARWAPTVGAMLTGLGGTIVFLAKPSSALLMAVAALAFVLVTNRTPLRTLIVAVVTSAVVTSIAALLISGSLEAFVERVMVGHDDIVALRPRYGLAAALRLDSPHLTFQEALAFPLLVMAALGTILLVSLRPRLEVPIQITWTAVAVVVSTLWLLFFSPALRASPATAFVAAAVPLGLAVAALAAGVWRPASRASLKHGRAEALLFACAPYIVAFGTAGSVSRLMGYAAVFWAFCAFVLIGAAFRDVTARVAVSVLLAAGLAITVVVIASRMEFPFRQHIALRLQNVPVAMGPRGHQTVLVDRQTARYFAELGAELRRLGFRRGEGVIDMTGESPGIVFAIGGVPLGEPWLLGRYPGSTEFAARALARVSCEQLANAWILVAPAGDRALSDDVLTSAGLSPHIESGSVKVRRRSRKDHHVIVPPQRDGAALQSCLRLRATEAAH